VFEPSNLRKVLLFGFLGGVGCQAGWLVGEMFLWAALPASKESVGSLASKPVLPPLASKAEVPAPPAPALVGADRTFTRAQPAPPPPELRGNPSSKPAPPPAEFAQRLQKAGAKSGDVQATLIWSNINDLDLHCIEPSGEEIFFAHRRSRTGGELDVDMNAGRPYTMQPVENIYWPKGKAPHGKYKVFVKHYSNHGGKDPTAYKVNILVGGRRQEYSGSISRTDPKRLIAEFDVTPSSLDGKSDGPELRLAVSPELTVHQGGQNLLKVRIARSNIAGRVNCRFEGDLRGLSAPEFVLGDGETETTAEVTADAAAPTGVRSLTVHASAGPVRAETRFQLRVNVPPPELRLAVSPALIVNQGHGNHLRIRISRSGFKGPIQLRFGGDLRGIECRELAVAETDTEVSTEIRADADAPPGERTLSVTARASSLEASANFRLRVNEIAPVLRLAVPSEMQVGQGGENLFPVRIARDRFNGPVTVRLEGDLDGLSPREFTIPAERDDYEVMLSATNAAVGTREVRVSAASGTVHSERTIRISVVNLTNADGPRWSWRLILVIGLWTALLTLGLSLALVMGQNGYLARPWLSLGELAIITVGSLAAGVVAGGVGQLLYSLLSTIRLIPEVGFLAGWLLLGSLLGRGLVFFIPNLSAWRAVTGGSVGGMLGAVTFIAVSFVGDIAGRFMGAAILGSALGLMVAIVEATFRKIWLEVVDDTGAVRVVNLGANPIVLGGDARWCTVMVPGAPGKALKFWEENGQIYCLDVVAEKTSPVSPGYRRALRQVHVVVCSNDTVAKSLSPPPLSAKPKPVAETAEPAKKASPVPALKPAPTPKAPPPPAAAAPIPSKPAAKSPPQQAPATPVAGRCPMCNTETMGIVGKRRCTNCWTMF
jgi:hypothetical protein